MRTALWFGSQDSPLFGRLHLPEGAGGRAGIVLCPPFGLEGACAARTYRILGDSLAAKGFVALGFDYEGTGDSAGSGDGPGRLRPWGRSLHEAVELLRSMGMRSVAVVGMRLGATLAAWSSEDLDLDALVLWDPCESGRAYLREQQALRAARLGDRVMASPEVSGNGASTARSDVEVLGAVYHQETVKELSQLKLASAPGHLARKVLVLTRSDRPLGRETEERLGDEKVEWAQATGQLELIGVPPGLAEVPRRTVRELTNWISRKLGSEAIPFAPPRRTSAAVDALHGEEVTEEIRTLGPHGLFGILTKPATIRSEVTVVMLNAGLIDHVGPARLWVHLARLWALSGIRTLRFDIGGLGDSPARPGQEDDIMYPPSFFDDLEDVTAELSPDDPRKVVLVGLCSGGYHAVEGGIALGARGVCAINPIIPRNPLNQPGRSLSPRPADPRRQAAATRKAWVKKLPAHDRLAALGDKMPGAVWWVFDRIGAELPPAKALGRLVERGVETLVVCGENEARVIRRGESAFLRRMERTGSFRLEMVPGIDHELFQRAARDRVEQLLTDHLTKRFTLLRT